MDKKFFIVLLVTVFYNGVINSSPAKEITSELITKEKQNVTPEASNQTSKVETTTMPVSQNKTLHDEVAAVKNVTSIVNTKTVANNSTAVNATGKGLSVGNETQTVASNNATVATSTVSSVASPVVSPVASPVVSPAASPVPVTNKPSNVSESKPTTTGAIASGTEMPRPVASNQSSTTATTVTTVNAGTTTVAPVTKPTIVTTTPSVEMKNNTNSNGGVTVEHNSASQSQGSRFDGASFVGGIVLTVGLTAIGFIAFKYYKSGRIDGNYRTL